MLQELLPVRLRGGTGPGAAGNMGMRGGKDAQVPGGAPEPHGSRRAAGGEGDTDGAAPASVGGDLPGAAGSEDFMPRSCGICGKAALLGCSDSRGLWVQFLCRSCAKARRRGGGARGLVRVQARADAAGRNATAGWNSTWDDEWSALIPLKRRSAPHRPRQPTLASPLPPPCPSLAPPLRRPPCGAPLTRRPDARGVRCAVCNRSGVYADINSSTAEDAGVPNNVLLRMHCSAHRRLGEARCPRPPPSPAPGREPAAPARHSARGPRD